MKFRIIHVGKTSSEELSGFISEFAKRCGRFAKLEIQAVDTIKSKKADPQQVKKQEGERILKKVGHSDLLILLDENGKQFDSKGFAKLISDHFLHSGTTMVFAIGGAYGFSEEVKNRSHRKISLSPMTFNHELALAVFSEQLYRGLTIINGHPYHNP